MAAGTTNSALARLAAGGGGRQAQLARGGEPAPVDELAARRARIMDALPDGILLLHARSEAKAEDQAGFVQDASFAYFTGLTELAGAVLALDGPRRQVRLFVPPPPLSFGQPVVGLGPEPGEHRAVGLDAVEPWERFVPWLRERLGERPTLYVDAPRRPEMTGNPPGMPPIAGHFATWTAALRATFPEARVESALPALRELRWVKSEREIAILRTNAAATAVALRAAAGRIAPGTRQRSSEAAVVAACLEAGAQGPSFWPWTMSGPNTGIGELVRAFYSYEHLDREMSDGELVRVDIGCRGGGYGADVGRTLPVSGLFTEAQREVHDLLIDGYLAGLDAIRDGVTVQQVRAASRARVRARAASIAARTADPEVRSSMAVGPEAARAVAEAARLLDSDRAWHLHGVGVESGEAAQERLHTGVVLAYEPGVAIGDDAFYLEDMIAVTATGHEVLSAGLPYSAQAIERLMARVGTEARPTAGASAASPADGAGYAEPPVTEVHFVGDDGTRAWGDLYPSPRGRSAPLVVLLHQSASNAGEYEPTARRLQAEGYNALALDARGGGDAYARRNRTVRALDHHYGGPQAYHDFKAALAWADREGFTGPRVIWGSSYSAGRMFQLLAERPRRVVGALAFSPGAGFARPEPDGGPSGAELATIPVFMTWSPDELDDDRRARFELVGSPDKTLFLQQAGVHGSASVRADRNPEGWERNLDAALAFIRRHAALGSDGPALQSW